MRKFTILLISLTMLVSALLGCTPVTPTPQPSCFDGKHITCLPPGKIMPTAADTGCYDGVHITCDPGARLDGTPTPEMQP